MDSDRVTESLLTLRKEREHFEVLQTSGEALAEYHEARGTESPDQQSVVRSRQRLSEIDQLEQKLEQRGIPTSTTGRLKSHESDQSTVIVTDYQGNDHQIILSSDGAVITHNQKGYPINEAEQTPTEAEIIRQAERYARWIIYNETDESAEIFPWQDRWPSILSLKDRIEQLSRKEFQRMFGQYYAQLTGGYRPDITRPVPVPESAKESDRFFHFVDVYDGDDNVSTTDNTSIFVTDPGVGYYDDSGNCVMHGIDPQRDAEPMARLELPPSFVPTRRSFRKLLITHLVAQIRDFWITIGIVPGVSYRILGPGKQRFSRLYENSSLSIYPKYHRYTSNIPGYRCEYDYGMGPIGRSIIELSKLTSKFVQ